MNIQATVALDKQERPERYCAHRRCLWALRSGPCPKHMTAGEEEEGNVKQERLEQIVAYGNPVALREVEPDGFKTRLAYSLKSGLTSIDRPVERVEEPMIIDPVTGARERL